MTNRAEAAAFAPVQCKAGRALLGWSQADLASRAAVATSTVADFERGERTPVPNNLEAIKSALEKAGIIFPRGGAVASPPLGTRPIRSKVSSDRLRPIRWITESDLAQWADRRDGQEMLPELVRRLIIAEQGYWPLFRFPSGDSVQMRGWDGVLRTDVATDNVPRGWSGWEMSADKGPAAKARRVYSDRTKNPLQLHPAEATFVFVTPRRYAGKDEWTRNSRAEKKWADVRALDAVDLVQWIERFPGVGLWMSRQIGRDVTGIRELGEVWREWSISTKLPLSESLVLADRDEQAARVLRWVYGEPSILSVEAEAPVEAVAFLHAALGQLPADYRDYYHSQAVVVASAETARALADVEAHLIIVLEQPDPGVAGRLVEKGHHVLMAFASALGLSTDSLLLPRPTRHSIAHELKEIGFRPGEAEKFAHDSARSLTILQRLVPAAAGYQPPSWATPEIGRNLFPVLFAGAWDETNSDDRDCIARLANEPYEVVVGNLTGLLPQSDSPLRKAGRIWKIASPRDAWFRLAPYLSEGDLDRFESVAKNVLSLPDPRFHMSEDERMFAPLEGETARHSGYLRTGIAEAVVLVGVFGAYASAVPNASNRSVAIVRHLLGEADDEKWWSLSDQLSELAEAAPEAFLDCITDSLARNDPPLLALFKENGGLFGRAYHADVLWALERLAWSELYLPRVTEILARLAALDPGGSLSNRPAASLRKIYLLWHPQTNVRLDSRLKILRRLRETEPEIAWRLILDLYPKGHDMAENSPLPRWRDFSGTDAEPVTRNTILKGVEVLGSWLLEDVGTDLDRWGELTERYSDLSPELRKQFVSQARVLARLIQNDIDRSRMQRALRKLINRHRKYGTGNWALPDSDLVALEGAYEALTPQDLVHGISWLFETEEAPLLHPKGHDWRANREASHQARREALTRLLSTRRTDGLWQLVRAAGSAELLGEAFANIADSSTVDESLAIAVKSNEQSDRNFAHGIIFTLNKTKGADWGDQLVDRALGENWQEESVVRILLSLPASDRVMRRVSSIGKAIEKAYWSQVSIYRFCSSPDLSPWIVKKLLEHGRAHSAIEFAADHLAVIPNALLIDVLDQAASAAPEAHLDGTMFRYYVEEIFSNLDEAEQIDRDKIAGLEWAYLNLLEDSRRPPTTLHRRLATSPEFFVEVLSAIYRSESATDEPLDGDREREAAIARHAYTLLRTWHELPGSSPEGIDSEALKEWVKRARSLSVEAGRLDIGDEKIGEVLAYAPADDDGVWPCTPVRDVIEITRSRHLEAGFYIGTKNKRGVASRGSLEGGQLERDEAQFYRNHAKSVRFEWLRTAAVLDRIADSYDAEAKEHDEDVERRQW